MNEIERITDQLQRAFTGKAWHGPALLEVLQDVTAQQALKRPIATAHSIWEIVLHLTAWHKAITKRIDDHVVELTAEEDWPPVENSDENAWNSTLELLNESYENLLKKISDLSDSDLNKTVPGKEYSIYFILHGTIQHDLYHAGQIAILKKG